MFRIGLILTVLAASSIFLTYTSQAFPIFHFLLTPFWVWPFLYLWLRREHKLITGFFLVFIVCQGYFGFRNGFFPLVALWLICILMMAVIILIKQTFDRRIDEKAMLVSEKRKELQAVQKKFESRQQSLNHLEHQVASLLNLFEIARELSEAADFKALAENLSKSLSSELTFSHVALWIPSPPQESAERLFRVFEVRPGQVALKEAEPLPEELLKEIESKRQMVRAKDQWYFPAFDQNRLYSIFAVYGADEKDLAKIEVLSSFLALLVKKISLYETIRELSIVDDLTQVFVRRHFMERLKEEVKRSQRFKTPLSLLMLDIDHFKRYNDDFGHLVGDATLKKAAELIKLNVRRVDLVGRYGGEEFVVVMPETRQKEALDVAERIRSSIARYTFKLYHVEAKVTVSQGIATYDPQHEGPPAVEDPLPIMDRLIQAADKCLYQAKEDGRNRVMACKELV